jgi:excisionase family DNA binding protein
VSSYPVGAWMAFVASTGQSLLADLCNSSQVDRILEPARSVLLLGFAAFRSKVNAPVMQAGGDAGGLLTVKQVAARLQVSTATVYSLCGRGDLPFTRIASHGIRISERDVSVLVSHGTHTSSRNPDVSKATRPWEAAFRSRRSHSVRTSQRSSSSSRDRSPR